MINHKLIHLKLLEPTLACRTEPLIDRRGHTDGLKGPFTSAIPWVINTIL